MLDRLKNSLFASTSAFQGEQLQFPIPNPPVTPVRKVATQTEEVINLLESARLELTEKQYPDSIDMAIQYIEEAAELVKKTPPIEPVNRDNLERPQ